MRHQGGEERHSWHSTWFMLIEASSGLEGHLYWNQPHFHSLWSLVRIIFVPRMNGTKGTWCITLSVTTPTTTNMSTEIESKMEKAGLQYKEYIPRYSEIFLRQTVGRTCPKSGWMRFPVSPFQVDTWHCKERLRAFDLKATAASSCCCHPTWGDKI